ncbi:histidine--tRNA ligase [Thermoactinomyces sp. DSM 45891]|uniref:histidine--tRNA ligase n=1 Tax=Thermoactinomyces sp. DSM 45891 TaxID=1761907 RepID=UPI002570D032|nr:histidine--tRNA ligase [Thermoactinomyces sp. DSM 45891]
MFDVMPKDEEKWRQVEWWRFVESTARNVAERFHFQEVRTPIVEYTELFERGVGDTTDIVEKEMYTFTDRAGRSISLRPEGTAGIVRSFVGHKVYAQPQPTKWFYMGPMYRYERQQVGRYRQFHQLGVEAFGSFDPALDAEVIALGMQFFEELGLKGVQVEINNVGDPESRARYFEALIAYFEPYKEELAEDAQSRLYRNPMRILDSKDPRTKEIAKGAPSILDYLSEESLANLEAVKQYLDILGVNYVQNDRLVRGLDYYTQIAFEYMVDIPGAQASTIGGGGRYNGLVQEVGGPDMPGVGFGIGLERVLLALEEQQVEVPELSRLDCYMVTLDQATKTKSMQLLAELRRAGLSAERDYLDRKMKAQMKAADREQARFVAILGGDELAQNLIQVKNMETGMQEAVSLDQLVTYIQTGKGR